MGFTPGLLGGDEGPHPEWSPPPANWDSSWWKGVGAPSQSGA